MRYCFLQATMISFIIPLHRPLFCLLGGRRINIQYYTVIIIVLFYQYYNRDSYDGREEISVFAWGVYSQRQCDARCDTRCDIRYAPKQFLAASSILLTTFIGVFIYYAERITITAFLVI